MNLEDTALQKAILAWSPIHFPSPSAHQWMVNRLNVIFGYDRFRQVCQEQVARWILQGHGYVAQQLGEGCPGTWSAQSPVAWMTGAVLTNLAHHLDPDQARHAMQALMARHLGVRTIAKNVEDFYENLARHYWKQEQGRGRSDPEPIEPDDWERMSHALRRWNHDFAAEMIRLHHRLHDHRADPITVFRGINLEQSWHEGIVTQWFYEGHAALSRDGLYFKFFQFYFRDALEHLDQAWEIVGTYVSLDPHRAASYAMGPASASNGTHVLFEATLPQGTIAVCGPNTSESELILPELMPDVIYVLDSHKRVLELFRHPDHPEVVARFQVGDVIEKTAEDEARYHALQCNLEGQSEPQTPDMLDDYYGFSLPDPVDHCTDEMVL